MKRYFLFAVLCFIISLSSCDNTELDFKQTYQLSQVGYYDATCITDNNRATINVTKLTSDAKLIVVNIDTEFSDTIATNTFNKTYNLSKGKHLLSIECGTKINGDKFQVSINSKSSIELTIK